MSDFRPYLCKELAIMDVQICTTDATCADFDQDIVVTKLR